MFWKRPSIRRNLLLQRQTLKKVPVSVGFCQGDCPSAVNEWWLIAILALSDRRNSRQPASKAPTPAYHKNTYTHSRNSVWCTVTIYGSASAPYPPFFIFIFTFFFSGWGQWSKCFSLWCVCWLLLPISSFHLNAIAWSYIYKLHIL